MASAKKAAPSKKNAVTRAYLELRDMIVRGTISPGTPLIESRVAEAVGASRTTVRNALERLAYEGYVAEQQIGSSYTRFVVSPLIVEEMIEWYFIFGALDGIAARGAAQFPEAERRALVSELAKLNRKHLEAWDAEDPQYETIQAIDAELHGTYVDAGGGPLLLREHASLRPHIERYGRFYAKALIHKIPSEVFHEHAAIIEAIAEGNPDAAERAAVANWRNASVRFERVMRDWGERGNW